MNEIIKCKVRGLSVTVVYWKLNFLLEKKGTLQLLSAFARHRFPRLPLYGATGNSRNIATLLRQAMGSSLVMHLQVVLSHCTKLANRSYKFAVILSTFLFVHAVRHLSKKVKRRKDKIAHVSCMRT